MPEPSSPHFSHQVVMKWQKGGPGPEQSIHRERFGRATGSPLGYAEEADRAERSQAGSLRRCSRARVRNVD